LNGKEGSTKSSKANKREDNSVSKQAEQSKQKGRQAGAPGGLDDGDQLLPS